MTEKQKTIVKIGSALALLLFLNPKKSKAAMLMSAIKDSLAKVLPSLEGFSASPYWDINRWSWGYGTRVPGSIDNATIKPQGSITKEKAFADMVAYYQNDLMELLPLVKVPLKPNQWAAYLLFSYNTGLGNAKNLLANINAQDSAALKVQWGKYIYAGGVINDNLVARRAKEWQLWAS
jgi:GH24 family phage-related lysozyme (muramidase)